MGAAGLPRLRTSLTSGSRHFHTDFQAFAGTIVIGHVKHPLETRLFD